MLRWIPLVVLGGGTALLGCGTHGDRVEFGGNASAATARRPARPQVRWDEPMADGLVTTLDRARVDGRLDFDPPRPGPGMEPVLVQVSRPEVTAPEARRLYMTFRMPPSADFPEDGRITVSVKPTLATVETLREMDRRNEPADAFRMVTVAGREALLIESNGLGRVQYVADGLLYDVYGPALPAARAVHYAEKAFFGR